MKFVELLKKNSYEKRYKRLDVVVTVLFLLLLVASCIMVYSATFIGNSYGMFTNFIPVAGDYFFKRQGMWSIISFLVFIFFSMFFPYEFFKDNRLHKWLFIVIIVLLLIPQFQSNINGAKSWIKVGSYTFQPSVLAQIFIIFYMALILDSRRIELMKSLKVSKIIEIFWIPLVILFLIFIQNDTGTMLITTTVVFCMFFCSNVNFKNIFNIFKIGFFSSVILILFSFVFKKIFYGNVSSYRINRFKVFLDPFNGVEDSNNQIVNSLIAFGNGGFTGRGLGNSIQKLGYLPEAHTDFILAITAEEFGFIGVLALVGTLGVIIYKIIRVAIRSKNTFDSIFAIGFAILLFVQTIVNVGGVTASLPMTGVPIPFFSYGGSSLLFISGTLGIVMNILSHIKYREGSL